MQSCSLQNRAIITVQGADGRTSNNLLSNTVDDKPVWSAVCTPQGTILYTVFVVPHQGIFMWIVLLNTVWHWGSICINIFCNLMYNWDWRTRGRWGFS